MRQPIINKLAQSKTKPCQFSSAQLCHSECTFDNTALVSTDNICKHITADANTGK